MSHRAIVITCSDRAVNDPAEDRAGPILRDALTALGFDVSPAVCVRNERAAIRSAVLDAVRDGCRVIVTAGGTGVGPRDVTTEATRDLVAFELPGLMEEVRRRGAASEPRALVSRGIAGVIGEPGATAPRAVFVAAPGSRGGARDTVDVVGPQLGYLVRQLDGAGHDERARRA